MTQIRRIIRIKIGLLEQGRCGPVSGSSRARPNINTIRIFSSGVFFYGGISDEDIRY